MRVNLIDALLLHGGTDDNLALFDLPQGVAIFLNDRPWQHPTSKFWQIEELIGVGIVGFDRFKIRLAQRTIDDGTLKGRVALPNDVTQRKVFLRHWCVG